jgi:hypothetical protein
MQRARKDIATQEAWIKVINPLHAASCLLCALCLQAALGCYPWLLRLLLQVLLKSFVMMSPCEGWFML